jgi:hypothetical protein
VGLWTVRGCTPTPRKLKKAAAVVEMREIRETPETPLEMFIQRNPGYLLEVCNWEKPR